MSLREKYNNWSLGRQLQVSFVLSAFFLTAVLVLITNYQLDWLLSKVTNNTSTVITNNLLDSMHSLGDVEAKHLALIYQNYISSVTHLKDIDSIVLGFTSSGTVPFMLQTPTYSSSLKQGQYNFTTGAYFSSYTSSAAGNLLVTADTPMDQIYPFIYSLDFLGMKQAYNIDATTHYYPGTYTASTYNPLIREWYYRAVANAGQVVITEPYVEAKSKLLVITASITIDDENGKQYGAAGVNVVLQNLTSVFNTIKILENGFALIVSIEGMALTLPEKWAASQSEMETFRIFDLQSTGISEYEWRQIQTLGPREYLSFNDTNGTWYYSIINRR